MRILAITKRILLTIFRDKRTLVLLFVGPIFIMWLLSIMFSASDKTNVSIGTYNVSSAVVKNLTKVKHVSVKKFYSKNKFDLALKDYHVDTILSKNNNTYHIRYANIDSEKTGLAKQAIQVAIQKAESSGIKNKFGRLQLFLPKPLQKQLTEKMQQPEIDNSYQYGNKNTGYFNKITPVFMGFFVFFFVFLVSGMSLLKERTSGTLTRVLATPVHRGEIVAGYMLSYGLIAVLQTLVIVIVTISLLHVEVVGNLGYILLINFLLSLVALAIGIFVSTFASSEFQMMQFIPLIVVPQVFFSGVVPLNGMPVWVSWISKIFPLTYAADAMNNVILKGQGFTQIVGDLLILCLFLIIFITFNVLGLKRYRKV